MLGFPAITLRDAIERPEAIDTGAIIATGLNPVDVVDSVRIAIEDVRVDGRTTIPNDYTIHDSSRRVVNFIRTMTGTHHLRHGIRR